MFCRDLKKYNNNMILLNIFSLLNIFRNLFSVDDNLISLIAPKLCITLLISNPVESSLTLPRFSIYFFKINQ